VGIGATFVESFNGFDVNLGASYFRAEAGDTTKTQGGDDQEQVIVSLNLGTAGFSVGAAYGTQLEGRFNSTGTESNEGENWSVGAAYATGPWTVGVAYMHGEVEGDVANSSDDEIDVVSGGISYALGPGITTDFTILWSDTEDEAGASQDGVAGIIGISVGF
jgi:predicted porin